MNNRIILISNVIFEPFWQMYLKDVFGSLITDLHTDFISYDDYENYSDCISAADYVVVCLNFESFYLNLPDDVFSERITYDSIVENCVCKCKKLYSFIKTYSLSQIIWFGFEDYYHHNDIICGTVPVFGGVVDKINVSLLDTFDDDVYIDLKGLIAKIGITSAYDNKGKYRWNAPYSKELISIMVNEVFKQYLIHIGKTTKCIVLDCDNVLWGGILDEDGIEGIHISNSGFGRPFHDFQRFLIELYYRGIILTVCSKNDEVNVLRVFKEHTGMLLKEEHVSYFCCNWGCKANNIKRIAEKLNISLDSIVFVDDSPHEIDTVKSILPEVTSVLYHRDTIYSELSYFNLQSKVNIKTIKQRTNTYKTNVKREDVKRNTNSIEEYIYFLEMNVDIHKTMKHELSRISELTLRTNKCTNGIKYTIEQLKTKINISKYEMYTVCLSDKFSDLGIVGVIGKIGQTVDLFSLSCRALGRNVEDTMLKYLLQKEAYTVRYIETGKNNAMRKLFNSYGLKPVDAQPVC